MDAIGFNTFEKQDKILVGMSGGVDSSVAVRILQEQGFAVQGAVIRFSPAHDAAVEAAKDAGAALGVPVHVIDAAEAFEREVVTPFCESYCAGRTPNPCILCNPAVKFRLLAQKADELGCPSIATGHYARVCAVRRRPVPPVHGRERRARPELYAVPPGAGHPAAAGAAAGRI